MGYLQVSVGLVGYRVDLQGRGSGCGGRDGNDMGTRGESSWQPIWYKQGWRTPINLARGGGPHNERVPTNDNAKAWAKEGWDRSQW